MAVASWDLRAVEGGDLDGEGVVQLQQRAPAAHGDEKETIHPEGERSEETTHPPTSPFQGEGRAMNRETGGSGEEAPRPESPGQGDERDEKEAPPPTSPDFGRNGESRSPGSHLAASATPQGLSVHGSGDGRGTDPADIWAAAGSTEVPTDTPLSPSLTNPCDIILPTLQHSPSQKTSSVLD
jgi:hypothetical protein